METPNRSSLLRLTQQQQVQASPRVPELLVGAVAPNTISGHSVQMCVCLGLLHYPTETDAGNNQMQQQVPQLSTGFCKMLMEQETAIKVPWNPLEMSCNIFHGNAIKYSMQLASLKETFVNLLYLLKGDIFFFKYVSFIKMFAVLTECIHIIITLGFWLTAS